MQASNEKVEGRGEDGTGGLLVGSATTAGPVTHEVFFIPKLMTLISHTTAVAHVWR